MLLQGASGLDRRRLKMLNSEQGCAFQGRQYEQCCPKFWESNPQKLEKFWAHEIGLSSVNDKKFSNFDLCYADHDEMFTQDDHHEWTFVVSPTVSTNNLR